jgi:hypothetical protein
MPKNYIENMIEKIRDSIRKERFRTVGNKFYELTKYGLTVENKMLVLLASELADVFRNCLSDYKIISKDIDKGDLGIVTESVFKLLEYLNQDIENLDETQKAQIFDILANAIYNAEKILDLSDEILLNKGMIRNIRRSFEENLI